MTDSSLLKPIASQSPDQAPTEIAKALVGWFNQEGKTYPWRETTDPYAILVSEIMLQQTQITTVLGKGFYTRWMERFPNTTTLAKATEDEVLKQWEGLGYYSRARNLQKQAKHIETELSGKFPTEHADILKLPGVGPYTAGAVTSFAFNKPAPIVDGNVARVLSRLFDENEPIDSTQGQKHLWQRSEALLDRDHPRAFNSAIMELGNAFAKNLPLNVGNALSPSPASPPLLKPSLRKDKKRKLFRKMNGYSST